MSKEDVIFSGSKIKYKGLFDLDLLYKNLRDWLMSQKYGDPKEVKYSEKVKPDGKSIEFIWKTSKSEEVGYFKINLEIKFNFSGINEVETERDGKKLKLHNGGVEIQFDSSLSRNAKNEWNESGMMFKLYERFIIPDKINFFKIETYKDTVSLMDEVKAFLNLYRFD